MADLDRLRELDQATYDRIMLGIPIGPRGMYLTYDMGERRAHQYKEAYVSFVTLPHEAQSAWLQWCLQEAIAAREWFYGQFSMSTPGPHYCDITDSNDVDRQWAGSGDTPTAALLAAYIAALEAQLRESPYLASN